MPPTQEQIAQLCERLDAESFASHFDAVDRATRRALGLGMVRLDGTVAMWMTAVDVLGFNRIVCLGLDAPATGRAIDALTREYEVAGVRRFMVQLAPDAQPEGIAALLEARGFRLHNRWAKLWREPGPVTGPPSGIRVEQIDRERANEFARVLGTGFGFPEILEPWSAGGVGAPGWRHYLAHDGDTPCATAALFQRGDAAWLGMAATLETHRGRGAQSALIARRIQDAATLGCRVLVTETAEDTPARPAPSYRNMTRLGFQPLYLRPNYVKVLREA